MSKIAAPTIVATSSRRRCLDGGEMGESPVADMCEYSHKKIKVYAKNHTWRWVQVHVGKEKIREINKM
jgi:hypothetical protein